MIFLFQPIKFHCKRIMSKFNIWNRIVLNKKISFKTTCFPKETQFAPTNQFIFVIVINKVINNFVVIFWNNIKVFFIHFKSFDITKFFKNNFVKFTPLIFVSNSKMFDYWIRFIKFRKDTTCITSL